MCREGCGHKSPCEPLDTYHHLQCFLPLPCRTHTPHRHWCFRAKRRTAHLHGHNTGEDSEREREGENFLAVKHCDVKSMDNFRASALLFCWPTQTDISKHKWAYYPARPCKLVSSHRKNVAQLFVTHSRRRYITEEGAVD